MQHVFVLRCLQRNHVSIWHAQVVEPKQLTVGQLQQYDGSIPKQPMYLAIGGTIFDVSKGKQCIFS